MEIKSILITGCSGLIGRKIAEVALKKGYKVSGIDRAPCTVQGVKFIQGDICDGEKMMKSIANVDAVIHLAAVTSNVEFEKDLKPCYKVNVDGFLNVIEAARRNGCRRFVYASSAAIYQNDFSEDTLIDIQTQQSSYAKTKMINEMVASSYEHVHGMRTIGLRYFNVYGNGENEKGDYASVITKFINDKKAGKPLIVYGDGKQARDMINVQDAAEITLKLMEEGTERIYNVGTGEARTYREIAEWIDKKNVKYVKNPLSTYQYLTKADTRRLRGAIGSYKFVDTKEWIEGQL